MVIVLEIAGILGGYQQLKREVRTDFDLMEVTNAGLPSRTFELMVEKTGFNQDMIIRSLQIPKSTLARHLKMPKLNAEESEKTVRFVRAYADARDLFDGDGEKAREWLKRPNRGLGGQRPLDLLASELGARQVEISIGRLREGVFG